MARRGYDVSVQCSFDGCQERDRFHFDTQSDMARHFKRSPREKHTCIRHSLPDEVLSSTNRVRVNVMTNFETDHGRFWGNDRPFSGFASGPGFRAFADDFPAGTKIKVTTELIFPDDDN